MDLAISTATSSYLQISKMECHQLVPERQRIINDTIRNLSRVFNTTENPTSPFIHQTKHCKYTFQVSRNLLSTETS